MRIRWDRILILLGLLSIPVVLGWMKRNLIIGSFGSIPIIGELSQSPELKGLLLLGILLIGILLVFKILLRN